MSTIFLSQRTAKGWFEIGVCYRFVDLDGDVTARSHPGVRFRFCDEDVLRKDGTCERCGTKQVNEWLEHDEEARSDEGGRKRGEKEARVMPIPPSKHALILYTCRYSGMPVPNTPFYAISGTHHHS